jgi:hypothetical protein
MKIGLVVKPYLGSGWSRCLLKIVSVGSGCGKRWRGRSRGKTSQTLRCSRLLLIQIIRILQEGVCKQTHVFYLVS